MRVYLVTMKSGGFARIDADRYSEDGKVRFYQGNILHSEFSPEEVGTISEERFEAKTLGATSGADISGSSRS